jgi:hypothetical protein
MRFRALKAELAFLQGFNSRWLGLRAGILFYASFGTSFWKGFFLNLCLLYLCFLSLGFSACPRLGFELHWLHS